MHTIDTRASKPKARNVLKTSLAASLTVAILATSVVPSLALPDGNRGMGRGYDRSATERSSFHRHFYRGQQYHGARHGTGIHLGGLGLAGAALGTGAGFVDDAAYLGEDEMVPVEETVGYCAGRFQSYDPASGTYLGYDGDRHPCP